jgi:hypothetical protein
MDWVPFARHSHLLQAFNEPRPHILLVLLQRIQPVDQVEDRDADGDVLSVKGLALSVVVLLQCREVLAEIVDVFARDRDPFAVDVDCV